MKIPIHFIYHHADLTALRQMRSCWRDLTINLSELYIPIFKPIPSHMYFTEIWRERARNTPLNVEIDCERYTDFDVDSLTKILDTLTSRLKFWKRIRFPDA